MDFQAPPGPLLTQMFVTPAITTALSQVRMFSRPLCHLSCSPLRIEEIQYGEEGIGLSFIVKRAPLSKNICLRCAVRICYVDVVSFPIANAPMEGTEIGTRKGTGVRTTTQYRLLTYHRIVRFHQASEHISTNRLEARSKAKESS